MIIYYSEVGNAKIIFVKDMYEKSRKLHFFKLKNLLNFCNNADVRTDMLALKLL